MPSSLRILIEPSADFAARVDRDGCDTSIRMNPACAPAFLSISAGVARICLLSLFGPGSWGYRRWPPSRNCGQSSPRALNTHRDMPIERRRRSRTAINCYRLWLRGDNNLLAALSFVGNANRDAVNCGTALARKNRSSEGLRHRSSGRSLVRICGLQPELRRQVHRAADWLTGGSIDQRRCCTEGKAVRAR
jgi:hypothetical protein